MNTSIKKNFGYNLILTIANYIFPLIIYPYVSRVLGVTNIGACNFVDSIINYFVLLSALGVASLGVREIAKCKNSREQMETVFSNLLLFNIMMTFVSISILVVCTYTVETLTPYKKFLLIGILKLLFTPFTIEWFFQGIQVFKFITTRTIVVRILYVVLLFTFVHNEADVYIYYFLTTLVVLVNGIWNFTYSKNFVTFSFTHIRPLLYLTSILILGYYRILTSLYTTFNTFFLGVTSGDVEVGYFATATKINTLIMSVFTAFTTVMVPKVAEMLQEDKQYELRNIANNTFCLLMTAALPIICLCFFCANQIILLVAGNGYEGAVPVFRIVIGLILIIGIEQVVIQQFLMASNNNKTIFIVSTVGAVIGIIVNFVVTPSFGSVGSAIAWFLSELSVMVTGLILLNKTMHISLPFRAMGKDLMWMFFYILPLIAIEILLTNIWWKFGLSIISVSIIFVVINYYVQPQRMVVNTVLYIKKISKIK